jgi:glycosyltransferase involved in cell wall biosynthesis
MKNILVLTYIYPAKDLPDDYTPVVHYFTREWKSAGYNVIVIHNNVYFPKFIHFIIRLFKKTITKYFPFPFPTQQHSKEKHYIMDHVKVYRIPIFKKYPQALITKKTKQKQLNRIIELLSSLDFNPDVIIGHWANPQLYQVLELGKLYQSKTCLVMHSDIRDIKRVHSNDAKNLINSVDVWGFRSKNLLEQFEKYYGATSNSFLCYSGIPVIKKKPALRSFENGVKTFLFVGLLIPRKNPITIINAINNSSRNKSFHLNIVGEGPEKAKITPLIKKLKIQNNVTLHGRVSRDEVFKMMNNSDCFVMVSRPETFGLVYIEAMSMGCITIGSKNEGVDGIIQHGINGFLCNPGDDFELSKLLIHISTLTKNELVSISKNAIKTALELTDSKVAEKYIQSVMKLSPRSKLYTAI